MNLAPDFRFRPGRPALTAVWAQVQAWLIRPLYPLRPTLKAFLKINQPFKPNKTDALMCGSLIKLTDAAGNIVSWQQQRDNAVANEYDYQYDAAYQLLGGTLKNTVTNAILKQYGYAYDTAGNRTSEQADGSVLTSQFNNVNQLVAQQGGGTMIFRGATNKPSTVTVGGVPAPEV